MSGGEAGRVTTAQASASAVDIRFATRADIGSVMTFIDEHWSAGHVLASSRELMDWQHAGTDGRDYDYVIAARGGQILGVLGFVLTSRFDPALRAARTLWLALWKVRDDAPGGLGIRMLAFLEKTVPHRVIGSVGVRGDVVRLYRALGYRVDRMRRFYVLHPEATAFRLVDVPRGARRAGTIRGNCAPVLRPLDAAGLAAREDVFDRDWPEGAVPVKSARYFVSRFLESPFYDYAVHAVERDGVTRGIVAMRTCRVGEARAVRVVDGFLPPSALPGLGLALQDLLVDLDAECADMYAVGLDEAAMAQSGLLELAAGEEHVIIPNYYEPFERRNVELTWAYKTGPGQSIVSFKADADQDRPNQVA